MPYSENLKNNNPQAEGESKPNPRESLSFWKKWVKSARDNKKAKRHRIETQAAWAEYEKESVNLSDSLLNRDDDQYERCYPAYYSACKTIEPAYYARTPKPKASRRFGIKDINAMTQATINDRLADYLLENSHFDEVLRKAVGDFIHGDKTTVQIIYEADKQTIRKDVQAREDGQYYEGESLYEGEVLEDETGTFYETQEAIEESQKIYIAPAPYDEVIHTPDAKCWSEIKEIGFKFCMSRDEAEARFGTDKQINWKKGKSKDEDGEDEKEDSEQEYLDGWEIYCEPTKHVYWISDQYPTGILDKKRDPYGFRGVFPCPKFIIGSPPSKHLYPTAPFVHLAPTIRQLHKAYSKVFSLIDAIRRRALVDGTHPEVLEAFEDLDDREYIVIENLKGLIDKVGNVQNLIWYVPVQELVQAITELIQLRQTFDEKMDEWFGTPDILKGTTDPLTTAAAEQIASGAAHDRFKYQKTQIQNLCRDALEMMLDLAYQVFSDEKIARIVGFQYMGPEMQAQFPMALAALRNDEERLIRIDIETDSTSFINEAQVTQRKNTIVQTVINGMKEVGGMLQSGNPQYAAVALKAMMFSLDNLPGSEDFMDEIKGATDTLINQAMNPPQQPPPPDYEAMKIEIAQMREQNKTFELQIKQAESAAKIQNDNYESALKQQEQQFTEWLQSNYLSLDRYKAQIDEMRIALDEREKMIEEKRLAQEQMMAAMQPPPPPTPQVPQSLQITVGEPKARRRRIVPIRDEAGEIIAADVEEQPVI